MDSLDTNQVNFRGRLPKIMTCSNLLWCRGLLWNCMSWACQHLHFKGGHKSPDTQRAAYTSLQISKVYSVVHLCKDKIFLRRQLQKRSFLFRSLPFQQSLLQLLPAIKYKSLCKHTHKEKKLTKSRKSQKGSQLLLKCRGNFHLPQRGVRDDKNRRQKI